MASQVVPAAKRYRMSLLLDAYGEMLTEKQRTFIRHYYEEDLSFGEIAREYNVSRQAIFDSVKHGEDALETFEKALNLVSGGWIDWNTTGLRPADVMRTLGAIRQSLEGVVSPEGHGALEELDRLIVQLHPGDPAVANEAEETDPDDLTVAMQN